MTTAASAGRLGLIAGILVATGLAIAMAAAPVEAGSNKGAFPPKSHPYGKSYGEWGATWWQWAADFPSGADPITEGSGPVDYGDADDQPPGQVWFLAGSFGDAVERDLTVPSGKGLFFPLVNLLFWAPEDCVYLGIDEDDCNAENLTAAIEDYTDDNSDLALTVDGVAYTNLYAYTGISDPWTLSIASGSLFAGFGYDPGDRYPSVSGGHWMFLKPLPAGEHELHWEGANSNWPGFAQDITYNITVEDD